MEIAAEQRHASAVRARAHWLLALGELEEPARRPCMILIGGLPGSGKSTLSRGLAERGSFQVIRSDVVRKELAGLSPTTANRPAIDQGLYSSEWTQRTYTECLKRAEQLLFEGGRVIIDASFAKQDHRTMFIDAALHWGVLLVLLVCRTPPEVARERIARRTGDASDADVSVYERIRDRWDGLRPRPGFAAYEIASAGDPASTFDSAEIVLRAEGVSGPSGHHD
jgi:predicted kinase